LAKAISNRFKLARHRDKVGQDIFAQASMESWPSQGQVGEAQEEIHCEKKEERITRSTPSKWC
jgi:hypothetical protein